MNDNTKKIIEGLKEVCHPSDYRSRLKRVASELKKVKDMPLKDLTYDPFRKHYYKSTAVPESFVKKYNDEVHSEINKTKSHIMTMNDAAEGKITLEGDLETHFMTFRNMFKNL